MMHQIDVSLKVLRCTSLAVTLMIACPIKLATFDVVGTNQGAMKKKECEITSIYCYLMLIRKLIFRAFCPGQI